MSDPFDDAAANYEPDVLAPAIRLRFMQKTALDERSGCWLWTAYVGPKGYGEFGLNRRTERAHRVGYRLFVGPIPDGLQLDHRCRVRHCVNPAHLEAVTGRVNVLRGDTVAARAAAQTHCAQGHEFDFRSRHGVRKCRTCKRASDARYRAKRRKKVS